MAGSDKEGKWRLPVANSKEASSREHDWSTQGKIGKEWRGGNNKPLPERIPHNRDMGKGFVNMIQTKDRRWQTKLTLDEYVWKYIEHFNDKSFSQIRYKDLVRIKSVNDGDNFLVTLVGDVQENVSRAEKEILQLHNKAMVGCGINHFNLEAFPGRSITDDVVGGICKSFRNCLLINTGSGSYAIVGPKKTIHVVTQKLEKAACDQGRYQLREMRYTADESSRAVCAAAGMNARHDATPNGNRSNGRLAKDSCSGSDLSPQQENRSANSQKRDVENDLNECDSEVVDREGKNLSASEEIGRRSNHRDDQPDECPVCLEPVKYPKKLSCGHIFCEECISAWFSNKTVCPVCKHVLGRITGNQPKGEMYSESVLSRLPGFEKTSKGTIAIDYNFPPGIQEACHPSPGQPYLGTRRRAYLPDNQEGNLVLDLLRKAFDARLTFTIGRSVTTGLDDQITWNDIHHKTSTHGGPTNYGYPDDNYLSHVKDELAAKGIR